MITNWLGKILFRRRQDWQREREARTILATALFALAFAAIVGLVIFWRNDVIK